MFSSNSSLISNSGHFKSDHIFSRNINYNIISLLQLCIGTHTYIISIILCATYVLEVENEIAVRT